MNRLTKQKRDQLILVALGTAAAVAALWFLLISNQKQALQTLREEKASKEAKAAQVREKFKHSDAIENELHDVSAKLSAQEEDMASGDLYASMVNTVRKFKLRYKLDIPQFSPASSVTDFDMLPKFPYKQVKISISGTGYYEDIGQFIADFENEYAASRVMNLELTPADAPGVADAKEKLTFRMDIVSLVASTSPTPAK
jgi:Tfp pilus assembly protein PilO